MTEPVPRRRVVVTGIGVIASLGLDVDTFFANLLAGKSGIGKVTFFDTTDFPCKIGAEALEFNALDFMDPKEARRSDRYAHFALAATRLALKDAGLDPANLDKERTGVLIGSGIGGMDTIETQSRILFERGPRKVSPFMIPSLIANIAGGLVAIDIGAKGPNFSIVSACATASHSLGESMRMIRNGDADVMVAGGSEAAITQLGYAGFCSMKAMSTRNDDPEHASRPFDKHRDGFVMGEGAGILMLESLEHARARGTRIYCELSGYAATCDAFHITQPEPDGDGLGKAVQLALRDAGLENEQVDYINAHGTSTLYNDKFETAAIKKVFGSHAYKLRMSSTKSMTGHLLGAAGGVEAAACAKAIQTGEIPPTVNQEEPDPDCDLNYVPNVKETAPVKVALSNSSGFGGHNATLVFQAL